MTRLLLDYPWKLAEALRDPAPSSALRDFVNLLRRTGLRPVRFVDYEEENALQTQVAGLRAGNNRWQPLMQFLHECRRSAGSNCRATPDPEPPLLRDSWKCALRDELIGQPDNWRSPQIIAPRGRRTDDWPPGDEINIRCERCGEEPASGPHQRVLAVLEEYESHRFSSSDVDPWNLRRLYPTNPGAPERLCCLPKPPMPDPVTLETLNDRLAEARDRGSRLNGKYYFIPPVDWRWEATNKSQWRQGHAFPRKHSVERNQVGYCDYEGKIWIWHNGERHWDVQHGGAAYDSVNHLGIVLKTRR